MTIDAAPFILTIKLAGITTAILYLIGLPTACCSAGCAGAVADASSCDVSACAPLWAGCVADSGDRCALGYWLHAHHPASAQPWT